jgi:hypothetical protein
VTPTNPSEERPSTRRPGQIRLDLTQAHYILARDGRPMPSLGLQSAGATTRRSRAGPNSVDDPERTTARRGVAQPTASRGRGRQVPPPPTAQPQLAVPATNAAERRWGRDEERPARAKPHRAQPPQSAADRRGERSRCYTTGRDPAAAGHQRPLAGGEGRWQRGKVDWGGGQLRRLVGVRPSRLTGETTRGLFFRLADFLSTA